MNYVDLDVAVFTNSNPSHVELENVMAEGQEGNGHMPIARPPKRFFGQYRPDQRFGKYGEDEMEYVDALGGMFRLLRDPNRQRAVVNLDGEILCFPMCWAQLFC